MRGLSPTRRLAALAAVLAPVWILSGSTIGLTVATAAVVLIVALMAFDIVTMPDANGFELRRHFPAAIGVGDEGAGTYVVHWRWPHDAEAWLFDRLPAALEARDAMPVQFTLEPDGTRSITRRFAGVRRGDHALGPIALRVNGRLGLIVRTFRTDPGDSIRGIPSVAAVRRFRLLSIQRRMRAPGVRPVRQRGEGTSFANLRDYVYGDDPRHIDWKATARRGKVIAREYAIEQGQQILIVVDAGRLMTQLAGHQARFEYALSSALVLADVAAHSGDEVGAVVFDDAVRAYVPPARGATAVRGIRDALTAAEAQLVEPDYAAAFRTIAARQRKRALIVVFSDVIDVRSSHALIAHLTRSATRHLPLVVALRNEELTAAALPGGRRSSSDVFRAAAAEELLTARETALARMRAAGVAVVNVAPDAMTGAVVNRYLELKARSAI